MPLIDTLIEHASPEAAEWLERVKKRREDGEEVSHLFEVRCCGHRIRYGEDGVGVCSGCGFKSSGLDILKAHGLESIQIHLENRPDNEARV